MNLEYADLEPFEPTLRQVIEAAFLPPLPFPPSALLALRWAPDQRRQFVIQTFAAYGALQREVAIRVLSLETEARTLTADLKTARRTRDNASIAVLGRKIEIVRNRQFLLRRILDAVVYVLCDQYVWFIRRLAVDDRVRSIDSDTLPQLVEEAARLNQRDPTTFYLVADLTTAVQLGDFLEVSVDTHFRRRMRLVEVKQGEVNKVIVERLVEHTSAEDFREAMGEKVAQQGERIQRQQRRLKGLSEIIRDRRGLDPRTGIEIQRTHDKPPTPGYQMELRSLIDRAAHTGQHLINVDGCLTLAAIRAEILGEPHLPSAIHSLFHFNRPGMQCLLPTDRAQEEMALLLKEPPVVDLVEHSLRVAWASPIFGWGTLDSVCDLLTGRIKVYAQFNVDLFMERAARLGMRMRWVTGRRAEMLKQSGGTKWIPGSPRASAILVELPDGTRFELLSGGIARILVELAKPDTVLKYLLEVGPEVREVQAAHAESNAKK